MLSSEQTNTYIIWRKLFYLQGRIDENIQHIFRSPVIRVVAVARFTSVNSLK